jgi:putative addiction module component (TIGR02574 family)
MNVSLAQLFDLPVSERLALIEALWDSVTAEAAVPPVTEEQLEEIKRRKAELRADPSSGMTWEESKRVIREQHG